LSLAMQHTHGPQEGIMEVVLISEDMRQEQEGMEQKKMSTMPASKHQGSGNKAPSPFLHKGLPVRTPEPGEKAMPMQEERVFSLTDTMNKDRTPHAASPPSSVQETNVEEHEMDAGGDDGTEHGGERRGRAPGLSGNAHGKGGSSISDAEFGSGNGPSFLHKEMPVYPFVAKKMSKEGKAVIRLTIDETGKLIGVEVVENTGYGFAEAAIEAVKRSTFRPAMRDTKPVLSRALLPVRFVIKKAMNERR
jgi:TonB family protein